MSTYLSYLSNQWMDGSPQARTVLWRSKPHYHYPRVWFECLGVLDHLLALFLITQRRGAFEVEVRWRRRRGLGEFVERHVERH